MKETGGVTKSENLNYSKTSNDRIRSIFKSGSSGLSEEKLTEIKSDPQKFSEQMYGAGSKLGKGMGNTEPGDAWKYRGRGYIQLTGKNNYSKASKDIYGDDRLIENPDLANDPAVAANVSAWYVKKGQKGMAKKLGLDIENLSQDEANQLVTSQIAGSAIKRGDKNFLGGEVLGKVDKFAANTRAAGPMATASTQLAANKQMAPVIIAGGGGGGGRPVITPQSPSTPVAVPVRPRDESLQSIYHINAV
jgi:predicted chitinase